MAQWMVAVPADRYRSERLYQQDRLELPAGTMAVGDDVVLVAPGAAGPVVFGLARVVAAPPPTGAQRPTDAPPHAGTVPSAGPAGGVVLAEYLRRLVDLPVPVAEAGCADLAGRAAAGPAPVPDDRYPALLDRIGREPDRAAPRRAWMVSLDLPIEATSAAEAVRVFWTYVRQLGPAELPAFVWPRGDELAMRPYVLGAEHEMDPEEED